MKKKPFRVGMRMIKSAIALAICVIIRLLLKREGTLILTTAIICMYPTVETAVESGVGRVLATCIGALIGFLVLLLYLILPIGPTVLQIVVMPLGVILAMQCCVLIDRASSSVIAAIVVIAIAVGYSDSIGAAAVYSLTRLLDTVIGIVVSMVVNMTIKPYHGEEEE
ncbi:MAG: FUSC family protein [Christensenellaceae bacterium]|jgi:uncharacterized membrane protein YgaE (UPF0421/DUF939 family)